MDAKQIDRLQQGELLETINSSRIVLVSGPRNIGKRTLLQSIFEQEGFEFSIFDCTQKNIKKSIQDDTAVLFTDYIVLYEGQYLNNLESIIENALTADKKQTIIVCSSYKPAINTELLEAIKLGGMEVHLFAPSFYETASTFGLAHENELLEQRLIFGNYPSVLADLDSAEETLNEMLKDVVFTRLNNTDRINKEKQLIRVLQILAFSIGENISYKDIGDRCNIDNETVERYIELLEDAHILFTIKSLYNDNRYELKKGVCVYFADNGIRNLLIKNFNPTDFRNDMPQLWMNFVISERIKWLKMNRIEKDIQFWLTHTKQRMDYIESDENQSKAYKIDFEKRKKIKFPTSFTTAYPTTKVAVINKNTYWNFLSKKN